MEILIFLLLPVVMIAIGASQFAKAAETIKELQKLKKKR